MTTRDWHKLQCTKRVIVAEVEEKKAILRDETHNAAATREKRHQTWLAAKEKNARAGLHGPLRSLKLII
ncbi:hypothetical protein BIY27_03680 [Gibbsiella quercinecans]|uniref:Uncharacterized protein n=1 Tax=Gibbsiella quercinecans TaxID=929813 RepID=A0A250AYJ2_9GAMM|nr:hypothetical protein AWC35_05050 [Gibbsiella quercinecans]RLM11977.1 hypothetical protein BIY31_03090 [Gibbsiella quercinecans]RLM15012.1 hypothetical protein BIY30_00810 [Gibbsiella quercinecans]RLM15893.1 hypothetical protein BIY27_03680 [Gibbsiella quercinecans]